jgi:hypothetical protein
VHPPGSNLALCVLLVLFKKSRFARKGVPLAAIRHSRFSGSPTQ